MKLNRIPTHSGRPAGRPGCRAGEGYGGFTLLELVVASALLVVIMLGLLAMFYQTERAFRLSVVQSDTLEGGRTAMELLTRDFTELSPATDTNALFLYVDIGLQGVDQPLTYDNTGTAVEIRANLFQPFYLIKRINGVLRGVRYDFSNSVLTTGVGTLYRMEETAAATNEFALSQSLFVNDVDTTPDRYGGIVDGVVSLNVRAYDDLGNLITNFPYQVPLIPFYTYSFNGTNMPASVEVEVGIMEKQTLEKAKGLTAINSRRFISEHAAEVHLFRQRIPIRSTQ